MPKAQTAEGNGNQLRRRGERGAALVTVLFVSLLVMAAAGVLLLTTTMSATNAVTSTDEMQAYYAAEAGLQDVLNVLRGNVTPTPADGTKMNFKNAINVGTSNNPSSGVPRLTRWLVPNYPSTNPDRVTLSPAYTPAGGMAYTVVGVNDPDNSTQVVYSTAGAFNANVPTTAQSSFSFGNGVSLTYTPQSSTDITTNGSPALGTLAFSGVKSNTPDTTIPADTTVTLRVTQTAPLLSGSTSPISVSIKGTLSGTIRSLNSTSNVTLTFDNQSVEIPEIGTSFVLSSKTLSLPVNGTTSTIQVAVSTPEPRRLIVKVRGYGPRGAVKNLQMMVSRFGISYDPPAAVVVRGADSNAASTISIGSSANYVYSGADNAQGQPLSAFLVTNNPDFTTLSNLKSNNPTALQGDTTGITPVLKQLTLPTDLSSLPPFLQTTSDPVVGARAFVQQLRQAARQQFYGCSGGQSAGCDRYFNTAAGDSPPADFGTTSATPNGLFTFVDGDVSLPNSGGRGLLVVTGTLTMNGSQTFDGLVLVLGGGVLNRSGTGNGTTLGAFVVAKFDSTGGFLSPTFTSSGTGISTLQLDRDKVKSALRLGGIPVLSVSEY